TNPLMQQLRDMFRNETFRLALTAIYNNALMFAQHYVSPESAEIIFETNNAAISSMIANSRALEELGSKAAQMEIALNEMRAKLPQITLSEYRSCFFAYRFKPDFHALREVISRMLQQQYSIKLTASSLEQGGSTVVEGIKRQIAEAHFGIADITGNNPNVLWELGVMIGYGKPVIILKEQTDTTETPFDVYGEYRLHYQIVEDKLSGKVVYALLADGLETNLQRIFHACPELRQAKHWKGSQPVDMGWSSPFPAELQRRIVRLLTGLPNMHTQQAQRALIYSAGFDTELADRIAVGDAPANFVELLVNTVSSYGRLTDGRPALAAVLETAKGQVGIEKQEECERLIKELQE
ncbi:MAG: nucleotide-binding protein, partial [Gammaproteobacteria bacterium]|nr:nucleotide-binding protein [Gammaproteobacteria bacterium]